MQQQPNCTILHRGFICDLATDVAIIL
jgi:hypothetical protein